MDQQTLNRLSAQDRADLAGLLTALNGAGNSLRRDDCGDWTIAGSRGTVRSCDGMFRAYVSCRLARRWGAVKKALAAFCVADQDGDDEGVLRLIRLPVDSEIERFRDVIGLRQTRAAPAISISTRLQGGFPTEDEPEPAPATEGATP